jgi:hypothetical protein
VKDSPRKRFSRTYGTMRSTRGLSVAWRTRAGSVQSRGPGRSPANHREPRIHRVGVGDPNRGPAVAEPAVLDREPVQRPVRHHHAAAGQLAVDVGQLQPVGLDPLPDPGLPRPAVPPGLSVTGSPGRAYHGHHRAEKLVGQLGLAAVTDQPGRDRSLDVATGGLAVHPRPLPPAMRNPAPASQQRNISRISITPPPGTPPDPSRPVDPDGSVALVPDHNGARHAGGPTTANPGDPMNVARTGSDRSHDGGRRQSRQPLSNRG